MRILVTGATGFVGSHVAEALVAAGHEVVVTLRGSSDPRWLTGLEVERRPLDLAAPEVAVGMLADLTVIVHAAGITRATHEDDYRQVNVEGTRALLDAAQAAGVRRFVLVSSLAARGPDGHAGPTSAYGRSKREAEDLVARRADRLDVTVLRLAGVYGPRDTDLLPLFRMAAAGIVPVPAGGGPLQPVFATDVGALIVRLMERSIGTGPWPVAAPHTYPWEQVPALLGAAVGRPVRPLRTPWPLLAAAATVAEASAKLRGRAPALDRRRVQDLATHAYTCDVAGTEDASGWRAGVALPEGLVRAAAWYRAHDWL